MTMDFKVIFLEGFFSDFTLTLWCYISTPRFEYQKQNKILISMNVVENSFFFFPVSLMPIFAFFMLVIFTLMHVI